MVGGGEERYQGEKNRREGGGWYLEGRQNTRAREGKRDPGGGVGEISLRVL